MKLLKRLIDISLAFFLVILFSPLFLYLALRLWFLHCESPLFVQVRVGKEEIPFDLLKFKTQSLRYNQSNSRFLKYLRKTHLDELPQLINVIKGDMSLVGPRPHTPQHVSVYEPWQKERLTVKPGITCYRQLIEPSKPMDFNVQIEEDMRYIKGWTLQEDISILLKTFRALLSLLSGK